MYQVYCDDILIFDPRVPELRLTEAKIDAELNTAGSFSFTLLPTHPYGDVIKQLKSTITVYQGSTVIFKGRPLDPKTSFNKIKSYTCEGELAYLVDSIQRPFEYEGTPEGLFEYLITEHNKQVTEDRRFIMGNVTVTDPNGYIRRSDSEYSKTWDLIKSQCLDTLGGYLWVRHEENGDYIDWLADFTTLNTQTFELGKNILDITREVKGSDVITALIPLGAKIETENEDGTTESGEQRLTITEVNDGVDYVYNQDAVDAFGWIFGTETWDDVTEPLNLKSKAEQYVADVMNLVGSIEIQALDLAGVDPLTQPILMGSYVKVQSKPHGIDETLLLSKVSIDLLKLSNNTYTVGTTYKTLVDNQIDHITETGQLIDRIDKVESNYQINITKLEETFSSLIEQTSESIRSEVSETTTAYIDDEIARVIEEQSTSLTQTSEYFEMVFEQLRTDLDNGLNSSNSEFQLIKKYIRFEDGNILLGDAASPITLKIMNDRIAFIENSAEVAYFSNGKLYVTDAQFLKSLQLGNFAFFPRANGNLSFKKVG